MKEVAIILNSPDETAIVTESDIICADGGYRHCPRTPIAVIGDFDSSDAPTDVNIVCYPKEKDETDGQLAISYAHSLGYERATIYGALGGDIGHVLGNIGLLKYAESLGLEAIIKEKNLIIKKLDGIAREIVGEGNKVSLFPYFGDATVKHSSGLYYPLMDIELKSGTNRGLSNIATENEISLEIVTGSLLALIYNER